MENNNMEMVVKAAAEVLSREDIDILKKEAEQVVITDLKTLGKAGDVLKILKAKIFYLDEERKKFTKPLDDVKKQIMAQFKPQIERCEAVKKYLESKMFAFEESERWRQEKEGDLTPIQTHGDISRTEYRDNYKYEIIDENLVWNELKSPDDTKIKARIKSGVRELPGIRIYNEPYSVSTSKG